MTQSAGDMLVHTLIEILGVEEPARLPRGVLVGINSVTRCLESGCRAGTACAAPDQAAASADAPVALFVCAADLDPPALVAHLPMLTASYNAVGHARPLVLAPLSAGAEWKLSTALRVRRLSALLVTTGIGADACARLEARLRDALGDSAMQGFRAPWLERAARLVPPHVKHVSTSAPANATQAKTLKKAGRRARKEQRRLARSAT